MKSILLILLLSLAALLASREKLRLPRIWLPLALFLAGTAIAGVGFGGGFQGAIRTIAPLAAPHERAGVLSIIYLASYLALGLPAILAGVLVVHGSILSTSREYGATIMLLAALAMLGLIVQRQRPRRRYAPTSHCNPAASACVKPVP